MPFVDTTKYIRDLKDSVCILNQDGNSYSFTHRSFQEYFASIFCQSLDDDIQKQVLSAYISSMGFSCSNNFLMILYELQEKRFEKNVLLPMVNHLWKDFVDHKSSYRYVFLLVFDEVYYDSIDGCEENRIYFGVKNNSLSSLIDFVWKISHANYVDNASVQKSADVLAAYFMNRNISSIPLDGITDEELWFLIENCSWWFKQRLDNMFSFADKVRIETSQSLSAGTNILDCL